MTLDKAKETLQDNRNSKPPGMNHDYFDALKIGIEAILRLQAYRRSHIAISIMPLPGETFEPS